jgi:hypothetical protein
MREVIGRPRKFGIEDCKWIICKLVTQLYSLSDGSEITFPVA